MRELWSWLEERESELEQMDPPADDMDIIQQQTEQLEVSYIPMQFKL